MSSTSPPSSTPAGWYADPYAYGTLRWFDGATWTPNVAPAPASALPPAPRVGAAPSDPVHWLVPTGRSGQSIVAGYVALFATVIWPLGPVALCLGLWALSTSRRTGTHGRGRAVFAIVVGALATLATLAWLVIAIT
jgi:Protein of unknown function (DUF2510)/Domain of unknown function (DUF4190)